MKEMTKDSQIGMTVPPRLSICIPTYNRSRYIGELLDSIIAQGYPEVEVVVSDNASEDETGETVGRYREKLPNLRYIRQPENIGADRNFLAVVNSATGSHAWLIGDDDKLEPGAIERILAALTRWPNVAGLTLGVIDYDPELRKPIGVHSLPPTQKILGTEDFFGLLATQLGFMSACVVNRKMWGVVCQEDPIDAYMNNYILVYIVGRMVARFGEWGIVKEPCVGFRSGYDRFEMSVGWIKRMQADIVGYGQIADAMFADNPQAARRMRETIFKAHVVARLRNVKTAAGPTPELWKATVLLFRHYKTMPAFWYSVLPTLLAPKWLLRHARRFYQRYSPTSGARRARNLAAR